MNKKVYVVTSLVPGQPIDEKALDTLLNYTKQRQAELIVIKTKAIEKGASNSKAENLLKPYVLKEDKRLNDNLIIYNILTDPDAADPIAGFEWLTNQIGSIVLSSPKQRLKCVASQDNDIPRALLTPGAITRPIRSLNKTKRKILSEYHQSQGALIIEVASSKIFHFRHIQFGKDGEFYDLGHKYQGKTKTLAEIEALIPGDYHCGHTDPVVRSILVDFMKKHKVKHLFLHDFFDGTSVNHHLEEKLLTKSTFGHLNDLKLELSNAASELKFLSTKVKKVVVVKSNHDIFLDRWLDSGSFLKETQNREIGLELALAKVRGQDPLEKGLKLYQNYSNVHFLKEDESYKITPKRIECGFHGHRGPNGSRGSTVALDKSSGDIIIGHHHTPEILRNTWVVGTSTYLKLDYNIGPSSWLQTFAIVYPNGSKQLINVIKGKYKI